MLRSEIRVGQLFLGGEDFSSLGFVLRKPRMKEMKRYYKWLPLCSWDHYTLLEHWQETIISKIEYPTS
jgi:hypothetical protein